MKRLPAELTRAERIALFRHGIIGDLIIRDLEPGQLKEELIRRSSARYLPPGLSHSHQFHWKTLQRWYYELKCGGLDGLKPTSRARGFALGLPDSVRDLILQIRTEYPSASASLILDTLIREGKVEPNAISKSTLRRLFAKHGLPRTGLNREKRRERRRWDAGRVCKLWHSDVAHLPLNINGTPKTLYIHGILDDHSRFGLALEAREHEREIDFLSVLCGALLRFPRPDGLYNDNGACYIGDKLVIVGDTLDIDVKSTEGGDPEANGKIERFWQTMRTRCTDHLGHRTSLQDVNAALLNFLDQDYHKTEHSSLFGKTPAKVFFDGIHDLRPPATMAELVKATEVPIKRKVRNDSTFSIDNVLYEVRGRHLAGNTIEVFLDAFTDEPIRVKQGETDVIWGPCDPVANASRRRTEDAPIIEKTVQFDPIAALIKSARKENPK